MNTLSKRSFRIWCAIIAVLFAMMTVAIVVWVITFPSRDSRRSVIVKDWIPKLLNQAGRDQHHANDFQHKVQQILRSPQAAMVTEHMNHSRSPIKNLAKPLKANITHEVQPMLQLTDEARTSSATMQSSPIAQNMMKMRTVRSRRPEEDCQAAGVNGSCAPVNETKAHSTPEEQAYRTGLETRIAQGLAR
jgi:hypothetical protein